MDPTLGENNDAGTTHEPTPGALDQQNQIEDAGLAPESAPPSSAEDNSVQSSEPASMEEAITAALAAPTPDPQADAPNGDENGADGDAGDKGGNAEDKDKDESAAAAESGSENNEDDPSDDELKAMKPNVAKRVKTLLHQRNEARREVEAYRSDAEEMRSIRNFVETNHLESSEVADLFKFGALVKSGDMTKLNEALEIVMPKVAFLMEATGRSVPTDLRAKVESGELSEEMARQMGRERFQRQMAQTTAQRATQQVQQTQQQAQQQEAARAQQAVRDATAHWYQSTQSTDPDFGKKAEAMEAAARVIVAQRGQPKTPEEAVKYAQEAYEKATAWLTGGRSKTPTRPTPSTGSNGSRGAITAPPATLEEAILAGLKGASA